jgi:FtsH-binding integral membrane protein
MADESNPRGSALELGTITIIVYILGGLLLVFPALFLALGLQALGAVAGRWVGDPNSDDGEEGFATVLGALGLVFVLTVAGFVVRAFARRYRRRAWIPVVVGTVVLLTGVVGFCVVTITPATLGR